MEWPTLQEGQLVDVIAPASACPRHELQAGAELLKTWGFRVRIPKDLFGGDWLHANSDAIRWKHLHRALMATDSSAIWCARGGYGSMKLLPFLSKMKKPKVPKVFLGCSDITSLNIFFNQEWHWPVLHSPILSRLGRGDLPPESTDELRRVLLGEIQSLTVNLKPLNVRAKERREVRGTLVGGNWTTLMAGIGTPYQIDPRGTILFLEDVGERGYRLDRYWEQCAQMKFWNSVKALVLGDFTEGQEPNGQSRVWDVLKLRAKALQIPVYGGIPAGHGPIQRVLPLGVPIALRKTKSVYLAIIPTGGH